MKLFTIILGVVPILFFVFYVWQYTINVPFLDDNLYYTKAVVDVNKSQSLSESFQIFMRQHTITEHKTPVSRLAAFLIYKITGKLNFFTFAQIGNLTLFGILFLFWRFFRKHAWNIAYFLPIPFLLFQMQTYENQFWMGCAWLYYPIGLWQMVTFYFLSYQKPRYFIYAMLSAVFVTFIFSNGMFVFFPATLLLIYQKRYKHLGIMALVAGVCLAVYFSSYKPSPIVPPAFSIPNILTGFVLMLGSYVDVQDFHNISPITATTVGLIIIGFLIYGGIWLLNSYFQNKWRKNTVVKVQNLNNGETKESDILFITASMIALCMSAGAVAYSRYTGEHGFEEMFVSRYRFMSILLMCLAYLFSLLLTKGTFRKVVLAIFLPITILLYGYSYYYWHDYNVFYRERLVAAAYNFKYHNSWVLYPFNNDWTAQVDVVNVEAIKTGVYQLPTLPFTPFQEAINKDSIQKTSDLDFILEQRKDRFVLKNETLDVEKPLEIEQNIVLKSKQNTYLLPLKRERNRSRKDHFLKRNLFWKGFETDIFKNTFIPDEYTIGLLKIEDGQYHIKYSNLKVKL
jgi:hypothetical protein